MTKSHPKSLPNTAVGVGWYSPEQWELLCEVAVDRDSLDDTYADWQKNVENLIRTLRKQGVDPEKVPVEIDDLVSWCQKQKLPVNGTARSKYIVAKMKELRDKAKR